MKVKMIIIISLALFAFLNNNIIHFDGIKIMTYEIDCLVFIQTLDVTIQSEESKLNVFWKYLIYFIFYFNLNDLRSILRLYP